MSGPVIKTHDSPHKQQRLSVGLAVRCPYLPMHNSKMKTRRKLPLHGAIDMLAEPRSTESVSLHLGCDVLVQRLSYPPSCLYGLCV